jgi:formate--tetrahydrofolate ligase
MAERMLPIREVAERFGIAEDELYYYGPYKAKLEPALARRLCSCAGRGRQVLVTATTPTPAGEGKTTTAIGLSMALNRLGVKSIVTLREPSLGPVFGMKGGATGGGASQVLPTDEIDLHFTGDIHAVTTANNLLAAMIDNHIQQGNRLGIDTRRIAWRRVIDMNDRARSSSAWAAGRTASPARMPSTSRWPRRSWPCSAWPRTSRTSRTGWRAWSSATPPRTSPSPPPT